MSKKITWAPIMPLIGGFPLGAEKQIGNTPDYILGYKVSSKNDSLYIRYMNETRGLNIPYYVIDDDTNEVDASLQSVDIVVDTPFCSGLSMLNCNTSGDCKSRGSDAEQNQWIYKSTHFTLKNVKPKVMILENAPGLFTNLGTGVVENLKKITQEYGYSLSLLKTSTHLHGLPQKRERTFVFMWNSEYAPYIEYIKRKMATYGEHMEKCVNHNEEEIKEKTKLVKNDALFNYLLEKGYTIEDIQKGQRKSLIGTLVENEWTPEKIDPLIEYLTAKGITEEDTKKKPQDRSSAENLLRKAFLWKKKFADGKGIWDSTLIFPNPDSYMNALIGKSEGLVVHPNGKRTLTQQEKAWLMGMSNDFPVDDVKGGTIGQNVPVNTASDMVGIAVQFINGELEMSKSKFIKQNNINQRIDVEEKDINETKLF
jgi:site-specific DNA-cytosine methylase